MSEWLEISLGDCAEILDSQRVPVSGELRSAEPGATPYYGANGLQGYIQGHIFDEPLILIAEDGGYFEDFETRPIAYRISGKSWVNNHAHVLRPKTGVEFDFLFYSLQHKNVVSFIKGGTRAKLNQAELREIKISFPKVQVTQRRIAGILSCIDTAIEKTEALIAKHQQIKAGLMHDLFTRGVLPNGQLRPPRNEAPELYQETALGWIPREWQVKRLEEVAQVSRGKFTHRPRNDPTYLGGSHPFIQTGEVSAADGAWLSTYSQTLSDLGTTVSQSFPQGTIAITIAANIADTALLAVPMYFPDSVVGAVVHTDSNLRFIELCVRRSKRRLDAIAPQSAQKNINLQDLRPLLITYPSKDEQDAIATRVDAVQNKIDVETRCREKFRLQKLGLMQDLLTGKVPVTVPPEHTGAAA